MSDSVAKRSDTSTAMLDLAAKGRALMAGTAGMREAGEVYLPRFEAESDASYRARLNGSWLFNGYRQTVRDMTGRVFDKPVELGEGVPPQVEEWCENVDLAGHDLSTFSREVFEDALGGAGIAYIMVDAPPRGGIVTRAQAEAENLRPYFVHLRVEDVLGWKTETVGNVTRLSQFRVWELITEDDPEDEFAEVEIEQVRVLDRTDQGVQTRVYRKGADGWALYEEPTFSGLSEITVVPVYLNRTGFFEGEPLLDDLADVNIAHWQSQSDQRNILRAARVPVLFAKGREDDESPITIGAQHAVVARSDKADLKWVEHSGAAIAAGRQDLKDLEFQMEAHGLQLLVARPGWKSATGEALDAAKETSALAMTADQLQDALEQALIWMGQYGGVEVGEGAVVVNKEFGINMMGAQEMTALLAAVNTGQLSRETFLREMARRGMIRPDLDIGEELQRIEDEGGNLPELTGVGIGA